MKRHLLNLLTFLSLLIFAAAVAVRFMLPRTRPVQFYTTDYRYSVQWNPDSMWLEVTAGVRDSRGSFRAPPGRGWASSWDWPQHVALGFGYGRSPAGNPRAAFYRGVALPWWFLFTAPLVLPGWRLAAGLLARRRRRRFEKLHLCPKCGYDMRATPGRCPECGTTPVAGGVA